MSLLVDFVLILWRNHPILRLVSYSISRLINHIHSNRIGHALLMISITLQWVMLKSGYEWVTILCTALLEYKTNILTQRVKLSQSFSMGMKVNPSQGKFSSKVLKSTKLSSIIDIYRYLFLSFYFSLSFLRHKKFKYLVGILK